MRGLVMITNGSSNQFTVSNLPKPITYTCKQPSTAAECQTRALLSEIGGHLADLGFVRNETYGDYLYFWLKLVLFARGVKKIGRQIGLLAGPTGCGKSESVKVMCELLKIPLGVCDVSNCVEEGIVGNSINGHITDLYNEVKKSGKSWNTPRLVMFEEAHVPLMNSTYYSKGIKRQMLSILGGASIKASRTYSQQSESTAIPTKPLSVLIVGSFDGTLTRTSHGDSSLWDNETGQLNGDELIGSSDQAVFTRLEETGTPGEVLGRLTLPPIILPMPKKKDFEQVLRRRNHLNPMQDLLTGLVHRDVTLRPETVERITTESVRRNLGYRSLRQVCDAVIRESLSELLNGASTI